MRARAAGFWLQQRHLVLYPTFRPAVRRASTGSVVLVSGDNSDVPSYNGDMYELDLRATGPTGS